MQFVLCGGSPGINWRAVCPPLVTVEAPHTAHCMSCEYTYVSVERSCCGLSLGNVNMYENNSLVFSISGIVNEWIADMCGDLAGMQLLQLEVTMWADTLTMKPLLIMTICWDIVQLDLLLGVRVEATMLSVTPLLRWDRTCLPLHAGSQTSRCVVVVCGRSIWSFQPHRENINEDAIKFEHKASCPDKFTQKSVLETRALYVHFILYNPQMFVGGINRRPRRSNLFKFFFFRFVRHPDDAVVCCDVQQNRFHRSPGTK